LPDNELWHNGAITGIRLNYVIDNTAVGDVSLRVRVSNPYITGTSLTTVQADETFSTTMPATANTLWRASTGGGFTAIGIGYNQGLVLRIDRQGGTTADTATGNFIVTGITIIYSGYGPAPNGSIVNSPLFKP